MKSKLKVLIFIGHYLPGFKSGGILRSIENTVNHFYSEIDFNIVTRNHDFGDDVSYPNIRNNEWHIVGNSSVKYLDASSTSFGNLCRIVNSTPHNIIYLNSFFDPLTIKILLGCKLGKIKGEAILLAPRGEFAWASLKIKYLKKLVYILFGKLINLYENVTWHVSSRYEAADLTDVMNITSSSILIAKDLPTYVDSSYIAKKEIKISPSGELRLIFLSRISPEKNLDFAIHVLSKVNCKIVFDIYGTIEDKDYWEKCLKLIKNLPDNVIVNYCGVVLPNKIVDTFANYELFFFPSGGENYGHVIVEALSAGTPVLISQNTPWRELDSLGFGWDIDLENIVSFVEKIENLAVKDQVEMQEIRKHILSKVREFVLNDEVMEDNKRLFLKK